MTINEIEAGLAVPFQRVDLSLTLRGQDQQACPRAGSTGSAEVGASYRF